MIRQSLSNWSKDRSDFGILVNNLSQYNIANIGLKMYNQTPSISTKQLTGAYIYKEKNKCFRFTRSNVGSHKILVSRHEKSI